jgi:hypothetical protein
VWRDVKNLWAPVLDALMSFLLDEEAHPEANTALRRSRWWLEIQALGAITNRSATRANTVSGFSYTACRS